MRHNYSLHLGRNLFFIKKINKRIEVFTQTNSVELSRIISGCKKGNLKAQEALFTKYKNLVYTTSLKYCGGKQEAEDHVHDVFIVLFDSIKKYKPTGSFEGWIRRITIYKAIDKFKKNKTVDKPYILDGEIHPIGSSEKSDIPLDTIFKAIQELPEKYRLVFNLYQLDDYSHKEIAQMLSISVGTSKSNLHRAKEILKKKLTLAKPTKINKHLTH